MVKQIVAAADVDECGGGYRIGVGVEMKWGWLQLC